MDRRFDDQDHERDQPAQTPAERRLHLQAMADIGGVTGMLASELMEATNAREQKAEQERLAAEALAGLASDAHDLDSPESLVQLAALAAEERRKDSQAYLATREREYSSRYGDETAAEMIANERAAIAQVEDFLGDPMPSDLAVIREHERRQVDRVRADDAGWELAHRESDGWAAEVAEAEDVIAATIARHSVPA